MRNALIGHTGFVGANVLEQAPEGYFSDLYNSQNSHEMRGKEFDSVYCSGISAVKWKANKEPEQDITAINVLKENLVEIKTKKMVLISTIDVFSNPNGKDEEASVQLEGLHPYGLHRYEFESFVKDNFDATIIRLPGLFGDGIKKNIVFDFMNNNCLEMIHQEGVFQFYSLDSVFADIQLVLKNGIPLVHFATEPVSVREVASEVFGIEFQNNIETPAPEYDFRTCYGKLWQSESHYMFSKERVLQQMKEFVLRTKGLSS
jgi:nucleoside-diphosphate-sugar epimerase